MRKLRRNILRAKFGNKGLRQAWRNAQIAKFGHLYDAVHYVNLKSTLANFKQIKRGFAMFKHYTKVMQQAQ